MPQYWREKLDSNKHRDFMSTYQCGGGDLIDEPRDNLLSAWVYSVQAAGIQLQFKDVEQVREALSYFQEKNHGSTMRPGVTLEHYWQAWYERLPKGAHNQRNQLKLVSALNSLLEGIANDTLETKEA